MKSLLSLVFGCFSLIQGLAQDPTFEKGDKVFNLGLGFGSSYYTGSDYKTQIPLLSAGFGICVKDGVINNGSIGIDVLLGFSKHQAGDSYGGYKYTDILVGSRGTLHYPLVDKLDTYTGMMLGFNFSNSETYGNFAIDYPTYEGPVFSWFVGGRYYFSEKFAAMAEVGVGLVYLNLGGTFKF